MKITIIGTVIGTVIAAIIINHWVITIISLGLFIIFGIIVVSLFIGPTSPIKRRKRRNELKLQVGYSKRELKIILDGEKKRGWYGVTT